MLLFLENQDSFSFLLADQFARLGVGCHIHDTRQAMGEELRSRPWQGVVAGPGPGTPTDSGHLMGLLAWAIETARLPVLGVCLGHQAIGMHLGGQLAHAPAPLHGKVRHAQATRPGGVFSRADWQTLEVTRYHSLVLEDLPDELIVEAICEDGTCQALSHSTLPVWGVQFHPEAACTPGGLALLEAWLLFAGIPHRPLPLGSIVSALAPSGAHAVSMAGWVPTVPAA